LQGSEIISAKKAKKFNVSHETNQITKLLRNANYKFCFICVFNTFPKLRNENNDLKQIFGGFLEEADVSCETFFW